MAMSCWKAALIAGLPFAVTALSGAGLAFGIHAGGLDIRLAAAPEATSREGTFFEDKLADHALEAVYAELRAQVSAEIRAAAGYSGVEVDGLPNHELGAPAADPEDVAVLAPRP